MKIKSILTIMFLLVGLNKSFGQVTFQKYYYAGFSYISNGATSVVECADNGFVFLGSAGVNDGEVSISKTNSYGNLIWSIVFGETGNVDDPKRVLETYDGGFAFLGETSVYQSNAPDILLGKFDANGNRLWAKNFGDSPADYAYDFKQTSDSGFILLGSGMSGGGSYGTFLIKTNANGDTLWTKKYDFPGIRGGSFCPTTDGGYLIACGYVNGGLLMKIDPFGTVQWNKTYAHNNNVMGINSMEPAEDSTYILTYTSPHPVHFSALMKVNSLGDTLWTRRFDTEFIACKPNLNNGNIGVVMDSILLYLDKNGNTIWSNSFHGDLNNINLTHDNGFILCGNVQIASNTDPSSYLIKTDSLGNTACGSTAFNFPVQYFPIFFSTPAINTSWGSIPYINISVDSTYQMHEHTICTSIGIDENKNSKFLSVFPNPASTKLFINLENRIDIGQISLFNMIGQPCLKKDVFNESHLEIDVSTFEKGIYLLRIDSRDQSFYSKVIIE